MSISSVPATSLAIYESTFLEEIVIECSDNEEFSLGEENSGERSSMDSSLSLDSSIGDIRSEMIKVSSIDSILQLRNNLKTTFKPASLTFNRNMIIISLYKYHQLYPATFWHFLSLLHSINQYSIRVLEIAEGCSTFL
jgi:hypothetical protein